MYEYLLSLPPAKAIELDFHDTRARIALCVLGGGSEIALLGDAIGIDCVVFCMLIACCHCVTH